MSSEINAFTEDNITAYVQGCENMAFVLDSAIKGVQEQGKKPTILIPSRGAVPIYIIAASFLGEIDPNHILMDPHKTRHYPDKIFEYLSDGRIKQNGTVESDIDVVLYPFTADVTSEGDQEVLARQFRYSATKAYLDLISGDRKSNDLNWYFHLMSKMESSAYHDHELTPAGIVESLKGIKPDQDRQTIIIDTVISGRASSHILAAFNEQGQPAVPILAVDRSIGGDSRFRKNLKEFIKSNMAWYDYLPNLPRDDAFVDFPLITEDKGASVLGVSAVNFENFNNSGFFHKLDTNIPNDFLPQSCIWALPPTGELNPPRKSLRDLYIGTFHGFLDRCLPQGGQYDEEKWQRTADQIKSLTGGSYGAVDYKLIRQMMRADRGTVAKESGSHIITVTLPENQAHTWAKEFVSNQQKQLNNKVA
jgi:hypothetical protein